VWQAWREIHPDAHFGAARFSRPSHRNCLQVKSPPTGCHWIHEVKYDGYRICACFERGNVNLITRNGNDWTASDLQMMKSGL
jgi:ATP-dependent DNA ligase